jgi:ankyrin repeat protein
MEKAIRHFLSREFMEVLAGGDPLRWKERIDSGLDVNAKIDGSGRTALIMAAHAGSTAMCEMLLAHGANVNQADHGDYTPLMMALDHPRLCELLLAAGADVNAVEAQWWASAPVQAIERGQLESCEIICRAPGISANTKASALYESCVKGCNDLVAFFLSNWRDLSDDDLAMALRGAAAAGQFDSCTLLLQAGAGRLQDAIAEAASTGHAAICELLLDSGADVDTPEQHGRAPLQKAAQKGALDVAKLLLERGACVHADARKTGPEPIYLANSHLGENGPQMARLLIAFGAEIAPACAKDGDRTPFQNSVATGDVTLAQFYIDECGADLAQRTVEGLTLAQLAAKHEPMQQCLHAAKTSLLLDNAIGAPASPMVVSRSCAPAPI